MKCIKCGNDARESRTTEAIELQCGLLVIRNIPCFKCEACDEIMFSGDVLKTIEDIIARVEKLMQEVTIIEYDKAA